MALSKFINDVGVDRTTVWRWRKDEWLETINISGRIYVTNLERFLARAASGEFAKPHPTPKRAGCA
jgi:hypothetical protein